MRVLITRPKDDAADIADKLKALGHDALIAPLMEIRFRDGAAIALDGIQAILATSANGVRGIARRTTRRDVPLFAVGPQTAQEAARAGFATVKNAQGDGDALARATCLWATPDRGALLHAAGAEAPKSLAAELAKNGFHVRREILYKAVPAEHLSEDAAEALRQDRLDAVLLFSPRSARLFRERVVEEGLAQHCRRALALCISAASAAALEDLPFHDIRVAKSPDQAALLALLP